MSVEGASSVWIATDDARIADEVARFGGQVVMTSVDCANGTERCADAIAKLGTIADVIVNLQGDAPLSPPHVVNQLVTRLTQTPEIVMTTPAVACSSSVLEHLLHDQAQGRVGGTTVVFSKTGRALYFSKRVLPYMPENVAVGDAPPVHLHLGLYAYRPTALELYKNAASSKLEQLEGLEQLRFLDLDLPVGIVELSALDWDSIELNNPSDIPTIERILAERGIV